VWSPLAYVFACDQRFEQRGFSLKSYKFTAQNMELLLQAAPRDVPPKGRSRAVAALE
jgi:hypothetical protein